MKEKFYRFMAGRNGNDQFNRFLCAAACFFLILGIIADETGKSTLFTIAMFILGYSYFRMLSRNIYKRREENSKYLKIKLDLFSKLKNVKERWVQRKDYKFFNCPNCHVALRVPRGKGKIKIVCRKCGHSFIGKS